MKALLSAHYAGKSFIARIPAGVPVCLLIIALLAPLTASLATKEFPALSFAAFGAFINDAAAKEIAATATNESSSSETAGGVGSNNAASIPAALSAPLPPPGRTAFDFDGDGKADVAVWHPATRIWEVLQSSTGNVTTQQLGASGDRIVPADYDGDGRTDYAVYTPSSRDWNILKSMGGQSTYQWGAVGDIPVPADYDGDAKTDCAVWRASGEPGAPGEWHVFSSLQGTPLYSEFGSNNPPDVLVPADYDGDGKADFAVWRPSEGRWYIWQSQSSTTVSWQLGAAGDIPVPAVFINQTIPIAPPPTPTPTPTVTPTPPPTGTLQLSKEYIYAGSRMLAVEDANAQP